MMMGEAQGTDRILEFEGDAGGWVNVEFSNHALGFGFLNLRGPDGKHPPSPGAYVRWWQLPTSGSYRLQISFCCDVDPALTTGVRIRWIRQAPEMPTDGTSVTFTAATPGEWIMAPLSKTWPKLSLRTTNAAATPADALGVPRAARLDPARADVRRLPGAVAAGDGVRSGSNRKCLPLAMTQ